MFTTAHNCPFYWVRGGSCRSRCSESPADSRASWHFRSPTLQYLICNGGSGGIMATVKLIDHAEAGPEVRAVYDDIMATRKIDWINNFWKALANHPTTLKRTWESIKQIMVAGALDPLT